MFALSDKFRRSLPVTIVLLALTGALFLYFLFNLLWLGIIICLEILIVLVSRLFARLQFAAGFPSWDALSLAQRLSIGLALALPLITWRVVEGGWLAAAIFLPLLTIPAAWLLLVLNKQGWSNS